MMLDDPRLPARFWSKVRLGPVPPHRPDLGPCWEWTASRDGKGYSKFWFEDRLWPGHLLLYVTIIGPVPPGLELDHLCRNRACLRLTHLDPVTPRENRLRGTSPAARAAAVLICPQGHPYDEANTYIEIVGRREKRHCRLCREASDQRRRSDGYFRAYRQRRKEVVPV